MSPLSATLMLLAVFLGLVPFLVPLAERINLPYTVLLAALGIGLGLLPGIGEGVGFELLAPLAAIRDLQLPSDLLLHVFLPLLLFAAGLMIDVRRLIDDLGAVVLLALVAVLVCTFLTGAALAATGWIAPAAALLVGAVVATTDPAAVLAIFRDLGAPRRLAVLVEGESLFNDAAAIALFTMFTGAVAGGEIDWFAGLGHMTLDFLGGLVFGALFARLVCSCFDWLRDQPVAEVTLTVALA